MTKLLHPALLTGLLLVSAIGQIKAQDAVPFAEQLPDRVAAWLRVSDAGTLRERFSQSAWGRLMSDPSVADFRADLITKLGRRDVAIPFPELLAEISGELTIALMQPEGGSTDFAASLGFAEQATIERLVRSITDRAKADGKTVKEMAHNSAMIRVIVGSADAPVEAAEQAFVVRGQRLVATNSLALLREILDRQGSGENGSFAASTRLQQIVSATKNGDRDPAVQWFLDPAGFLQSVVKPPLDATLKSQEIDRLQAVGGSIDFATGTYDTISRTVGLVRTPVSGILGLLKFPVDELEIPQWVPNNVSGCLVLNWDAESAWLTLNGLADELMGPGKFSSAIETLATDPNGPMIHIGDDVFGQLTGRMIVIQSPPRAEGQFKNGATLLAAAVKDADAATEAFGRLAKTDSDRLDSRSIAGTTVVTYASRTGRLLHVTVSNGRLLVSESEELLTTILTPNPTNITLTTSDDYQRLSAHLPGRSSMLGIQRSTEQLQVMYSLLKARDVAGDTAPDLSLLPPFEQIRHHFLPTATYATVAPNVSGFQYVSFTLAPPIEAE